MRDAGDAVAMMWTVGCSRVRTSVHAAGAGAGKRASARGTRHAVTRSHAQLNSIMISKPKPKRRNPIAVALVRRHGGGSRPMKDRRVPRGGSGAKRREWQKDWE